MDMIVDMLEQRLYAELAAYVMTPIATWAEAFKSFNNGQQVYSMGNFFPAMAEWGENVVEGEVDWVEYTEPDDYMDALWGADDAGILDRAFSDTASAPMETLYDIYSKAQDTYEHYQMALAFDFFF
jgi:hypothetical protein